MKKCKVLVLVLLATLFCAVTTYSAEIIYEDAPDAESIVVAGSWNDWAGSASGKLDLSKDLMTKDEDGIWHYDYSFLKPGVYEYKFIIDGKWEDRPNRILIVGGFGMSPKEYIFKYAPDANSVSIAGDWNDWAGAASGNFQPEKFRMKKMDNGVWYYKVKGVISPGKHEYKFIVDNQWEGGNNRILYIDENGYLYKPVKLIKKATIDDFNKITVFLKRPLRKKLDKLSFSLDNGAKVIKAEAIKEDINRLAGYKIDGDDIIFIFDPAIYKTSLAEDATLYVAGTFNNWNPTKDRLKQKKDIYILKLPAKYVLKEKPALFKFVVNGNQWLDVPKNAPNKIEKDGFVNLCIKDKLKTTLPRKILLTTSNLDLAKRYTLKVKGLSKKEISEPLIPGDILLKLKSTKPLGVTVDEKKKSTTFRIYAPRANKVNVHIYDSYATTNPIASFNLTRDLMGVWEYTYPDILYNKYYKYTIAGENGPGDAFDPNFLISDPYTVANVNHDGKGIILDINQTNDIFSGWEDADFILNLPAKSDLVIMELSIRDFTSLDQSVPEKYRKKYLGLLYGESLKELKELGINAVELLPIHEFDDYPYGVYHWGYMTSLFFAPESTYATNPEMGSQVFELKKLVNELHKMGIAVIMDVVYNHVGGPNYYRKIDNFVYFRMNDNLTYTNTSGCGNDLKTENPMVRRLIIDSLKHFVTNYHIDGFRFDLAGQIDWETLMQIRDELNDIKPGIILIAEPWAAAPGYYILPNLKGTGWSAWNDKFRNSVKEFIRYGRNKEELKHAVVGYSNSLFSEPSQSINYLESHDDWTLIDEITERQDHNGLFATEIDKKRDMLGVLITLTSLGVPMISEGQNFLRSKKGVKNSYNSGDEINGVDWSLKYKNRDVYEFYQGLIKLRLSEDGKIFRNDSPSKNYVKFIDHRSRKAFGYIINADKSLKGPRATILVNANKSISVKFDLPENNYVVISEDFKVDAEGIRQISGGEVKLNPLSCMILFEK